MSDLLTIRKEVSPRIRWIFAFISWGIVVLIWIALTYWSKLHFSLPRPLGVIQALANCDVSKEPPARSGAAPAKPEIKPSVDPENSALGRFHLREGIVTERPRRAPDLRGSDLPHPMKFFFGVLRYFLSSRCIFESILFWQAKKQGRRADDRRRLKGGRFFF